MSRKNTQEQSSSTVPAKKDRPRGRANGGAERGPDRIPRGSIGLLYKTFLEDPGTLERSLQGDKSTRALALRMMRKAIQHPAHGSRLLEQIGDRLEGKPVQRVQVVDPQPIQVSFTK